MPFYQPWVAATFSYLGRNEEARAAAARYRNTYPDFDLTEDLCRNPFTQDEDREHYGEGLRRAGLA